MVTRHAKLDGAMAPPRAAAASAFDLLTIDFSFVLRSLSRKRNEDTTISRISMARGASRSVAGVSDGGSLLLSIRDLKKRAMGSSASSEV